jgi:hypothetical protein
MTNKPSSENTTNLPPKKSKSAEIKQSHVNPNLYYDLVEDLKKLRANISVYELLKFPFLLQKMLQSIARMAKMVIQAIRRLFKTKFLRRLLLKIILTLKIKEAFL